MLYDHIGIDNYLLLVYHTAVLLWQCAISEVTMPPGIVVIVVG